MTAVVSLDSQVIRFGFWCAVAALLSAVASLALPLDVPAGYSASQAERVTWLNANRGAFILGWVNQIAAMLSDDGLRARLRAARTSNDLYTTLLAGPADDSDVEPRAAQGSR